MPQYIWSNTTGNGCNPYVLFRKSFSLTGEPQAGELHLFADTRYTLSVNGVTLGHGPARFYPSHPEFDSYDITPFLQQGENVVAVIVNSYGMRTFHSIASTGGLITWGEASDDSDTIIPLATGTDWKALDSPAHEPLTAPMSFALNPGEVFDARALPIGWDRPGFADSVWPQAIQISNPHWGDLQPRSIPLLDERPVTPLRRNGAWVGVRPADEDNYSFFSHSATGNGGRFMAFTYLYSPRAQEITFGAWWGHYWMNGEFITPQSRTDIDVRQDFTATLHAGWNSLLVVEEQPSYLWELYLSFPNAAGIIVSAEKQVDSPHTFLLAGPWNGEQAKLSKGIESSLTTPDALPASLGAWHAFARTQQAYSPFLSRFGTSYVPLDTLPALQVDGAVYAEQVGANRLVLLYDFGTEVLGRPTLDFTAAPGTTVDLLYTERLYADGHADHTYNAITRLADRYIAREGQQQWRTFHPRGMRYLEVVIEGNLTDFAIHGVSLSRANYPVRFTSDFACSDSKLTAIWRMGRETQFACLEDAFLDCPARERGLYAEDYLIQGHITWAAFGDTQLLRRCTELFFLSQSDKSALPSGLVPSLGGGGSIDFGISILFGFWQYYSVTGDIDFLRKMASRVQATCEQLTKWLLPEVGLVDWHGSYIDLCYMDRSGINCALNCFVKQAFTTSAIIMDVLGETEQAWAYRRQAEALTETIRREFWDEARGVFTDRRKSDKPATEPSVPANATALLFGVADEQQEARVMPWLLDALAHNFRIPAPQKHTDLNVNASFAFYPLALLYQHGRAVEAEAFMRENWGVMLDAGAWTCWEYFTDNASRCHAWSASPTYYLMTQVLGVNFPEAGNPNRVRITPHPGTLTWASGVFPHPAGPLTVEWKIIDDILFIDCNAPEGVEVDFSVTTDCTRE